MSNFTVDVSQLRRVTSDLRKISPALLPHLYEGLVAAGEIVAVEARKRSRFRKVGGGTASHIAASVKVKRKSLRVKVQAGGVSAPGAAPINNQGKSGKFRHPLFGNFDRWYDQAAHPFLQPSREAVYPVVEVAVRTAIDETLREAGFY